MYKYVTGGSELSVISGIHWWWSWDIAPMDKGDCSISLLI